jgi:4-amino-4-deoxy-L-arabinose transferase-like glycosyltransferase
MLESLIQFTRTDFFNFISTDILPMQSEINFLLIISLLAFNFKEIKKQFNKINKYTWLLLASIFFLGLILRVLFVPHQNWMYIDEPWYIEAGKNILQNGKSLLCTYIDYEKQNCIKYPKPISWPFILSISFMFFGINNYVAINTSILLGSLSIVLMFLIGYLLSKKESVGLYSALLLSILPLHLMWSATAETHVPSLFFVLLTILNFLLYFKVRNFKMLLLTASCLAFTIQMRIEYGILLLLVGVMFLIFDKNLKNKIKIKNYKFLFVFIFLLVFLIFYLMQFLMMLEVADNITRFSFNFLKNNLETSFKLFNGSLHPILITILVLIGIVYSFKYQRNAFLFLLIFLILSLGVYLPFQKFVDRMLLFPYLSLIFLAGYSSSISSLTKKPEFKFIFHLFLTILILVLFSSYIKKIPGYFQDTYSQHAALETKIPTLIKSKIPKNCYIISEWPTVLSISDLKGVRTIDVLDYPKIVSNINNITNCTLYFEDMFCYIEFVPQEVRDRCTTMHNKYTLIPWLEYRNEKIKYTFYNISLTKP